jgi:7-carboxy-7-deazaguanine synthase
MRVSDTSGQATLGLQAPVQEVFSSVQGEGVYVGKRQIFVRFAHCHLKCAYCDTPMTTPDGRCHVEPIPGHGKTLMLDNPLSAEALLGVLKPLLAQAKHHSISFTGGEPLLYHRYLQAVFKAIQQHHPSVKTYLETSGTQPDFLETVLPVTDIIAMDIKLPSTTHEAPQFDNHQAFYQLAKTRPQTELFIKLIVNANTPPDELEAVRTIVTDTQTPIIIQPETLLQDGPAQLRPLPPSHLLAMENTLAQWFADVRVIPQTHKMLQIL